MTSCSNLSKINSEFSQRKGEQKAESYHPTVSHKYTTKTLGMLIWENITEVLPWRLQIEQLEELMPHAMFC